MVTNCDLDPYLGMGHALRATASCRLLTMDPNRMKSTPSSRSWEKVQISFQWLDSLFKLLITDADVMDMGNDPQVLRCCKPVPPCSGWPTPHTSSHSVLLDRSMREEDSKKKRVSHDRQSTGYDRGFLRHFFLPDAKNS